MKFIEKATEIIKIILSIVRVFKRGKSKHTEQIEKEIDELENQYKQALQSGDRQGMVYYRELIDLRLRNSKL